LAGPPYCRLTAVSDIVPQKIINVVAVELDWEDAAGNRWVHSILSWQTCFLPYVVLHAFMSHD
jgi:hypothetical protein